jgi:FMN reductase
MNPEPTSRAPFRLVTVSGGSSDPSTTRMLADRIARQVTTVASARSEKVISQVVDLRELAAEIANSITSASFGPGLTGAIEALRDADGIIASTPVYKAAPSGLFSSFFHILDNDLLIAKPVVLAATAGTARHSLVVDEQMRSLFAYMRTLTTPTSVFATSEDWGDRSLGERIERAAFELILLMESDFARKVREESWGIYQHEFGSAGGTEFDIDLESDLMRLATGGSTNGRVKTMSGSR